MFEKNIMKSFKIDAKLFANQFIQQLKRIEERFISFLHIIRS